MSNARHTAFLRNGKKVGNISMEDSMQSVRIVLTPLTMQDGLWDAYDKVPMGEFAEKCAMDHDISREQQDAFAAQSYAKAVAAIHAGKFSSEIEPVQVTLRRESKCVEHDEEPLARPVTREGLGKLPTPFKKEGTVTAGNASTINDGAAVLMLTSRSFALEQNLNILFTIEGFGDAAQEPCNFTTSPSLAIPRVRPTASASHVQSIERAGLQVDAIDYFEINEAFAVVAAANIKLLGLSEDKVNCYGGQSMIEAFGSLL